MRCYRAMCVHYTRQMQEIHICAKHYTYYKNVHYFKLHQKGAAHVEDAGAACAFATNIKITTTTKKYEGSDVYYNVTCATSSTNRRIPPFAVKDLVQNLPLEPIKNYEIVADGF